MPPRVASLVDLLHFFFIFSSMGGWYPGCWSSVPCPSSCVGIRASRRRWGKQHLSRPFRINTLLLRSAPVPLAASDRQNWETDEGEKHHSQTPLLTRSTSGPLFHALWKTYACTSKRKWTIDPFFIFKCFTVSSPNQPLAADPLLFSIKAALSRTLSGDFQKMYHDTAKRLPVLANFLKLSYSMPTRLSPVTSSASGILWRGRFPSWPSALSTFSLATSMW